MPVRRRRLPPYGAPKQVLPLFGEKRKAALTGNRKIQNNSRFFNGGEKMFFKKSKEKTAKEYQKKMEKINRQFEELDKLTKKYQSCIQASAKI